MDDSQSNVVAIDGPSGSGKSTIARGIAGALGLEVLDTGAMYRAITLAVLGAGAGLADDDACVDIARASAPGLTVEAGVVTLGGTDVSREIRGPEVTAAVSAVSAHPGVRAVLVAQQRAWVSAHGGGVVEGRDIGTVVFPGARVKVFLTASDDERARRRQRDEVASARAVEVDEVRSALARRDALDSDRIASPLRAAEDAIVVDTTNRTIDEVVAELARRARAAGIG